MTRNPRLTRASFRARRAELDAIAQRAELGYVYAVVVPPGLSVSDHLRAVLGLDTRRMPGEHANDCACETCARETWAAIEPAGGA